MSQTIIQQQEFVLNAGLLPSGESLCIRGEVRYKHRHDSNSVLPLLPILIISHGFKGFKDWGFFPYVASYHSERPTRLMSLVLSANEYVWQEEIYCFLALLVPGKLQIG
ncbi:hypothetical protein [Paenibacillus sp. FSL H7-0331]|uniref:hypothetical protein n=1 Tax=Paenibacillus sp. FSL H7-0331 TaxID=1920421 RepID=UPI001180FBE8|nr:hypothetical protein [Paenibacillus sp. FSL H7-0331]